MREEEPIDRKKNQRSIRCQNTMSLIRNDRPIKRNGVSSVTFYTFKKSYVKVFVIIIVQKSLEMTVVCITIGKRDRRQAA